MGFIWIQYILLSLMSKKRYYILALSVLCASLLLAIGCTRSLTIKKEFRLIDHSQDSFTYDVWSYGNWVITKSLLLETRSCEQPYSLLLAIRPNNKDWQKIELLKAIIVHEGKIYDILLTLSDCIESIEFRPSARIKEPYAVFLFKDAISYKGDLSLEIKFRKVSSDQVYQCTLKIPYIEERKRGLLFIDRMMSV